jgi:hypothetical protein
MHVDWLRFFEAVKKAIENPVAINYQQLTMPTGRLLGRTSAGTGPVESIGVTGPLTLAAGALGITGSALTRVNDTNVTATLTGTPATALLASVEITLGWTGTLAVTRGGTGLAAASTGDLLYGSASNVLSRRAIGSTNDVLTVSGGVPVWSAAASVATNVTITNDTTTNASMFPTWVTANSGNLPVKVSSTKLSFNPSTGTLATVALTLTKDADGPSGSITNTARPAYLMFTRSPHTAKVSFGALGGIEANVSYNMDYADNIHRFYDSTLNAVWSALNSSGAYFQFAPLGAAVDIWTTTGSQYLATFLAAGYATVSNGLCVGATIVKDKNGIDIGGRGNLLVGTVSDPQYKVYINGIDSNGSLLAESTFGGILAGKLTTASAASASLMQLTANNGATRVARIIMAAGGATDAGVMQFWTKATGVGEAIALQLNTNLSATFSAGASFASDVSITGVLTVNASAISPIVLNRSSGTGNTLLEYQQAATVRAYVGITGAAGFITGMASGDYGVRAQTQGIYFSTNGGTTAHLKLAATTGAATFASSVNLAAGTATAGTAPLKFTSGTNLTTAEAGAMEYNGTNLFFTRAGTVRENVLVAIDNVAAPTTNAGTPTTRYGGDTKYLGDPNRWLSVNVLGTTYKIPLYN